MKFACLESWPPLTSLFFSEGYSHFLVRYLYLLQTSKSVFVKHLMGASGVINMCTFHGLVLVTVSGEMFEFCHNCKPVEQSQQQCSGVMSDLSASSGLSVPVTSESQNPSCHWLARGTASSKVLYTNTSPTTSLVSAKGLVSG